jgi:large subunit ribosomal protein L18
MTKENVSERRKARVRRAVRKAANGRPRLSVHRTHKQIYAQVIDDAKGVTLASASTLEKDIRSGIKSGANVAAAAQIGKVIAERAVKVGVTEVVFDRGAYLYHGRVKALADAAREAGLQF